MRTCPACGKDTSAETSSPCTECGFSVSDPGTAAPSIGTATPPPTAPAPPGPSPTQQKRSPWSATGVGWFIVIFIGLAWQVSSNVIGCGDLFSGSDPGPTAAETEAALTDYAERAGLQGATVSCPADSEETEVGSTFSCTVLTADGRTADVTVTNREDDFNWEAKPFLRLGRGQPTA